jgi:hypothetical protein
MELRAGHGVPQRHVDAGVLAGYVVGLPLHGRFPRS